MKVVIQRSKLLDPVFLAWTEKSYPGTTLFPDSEVDERVRLFREIWLDKGELVTRILEKETGPCRCGRPVEDKKADQGKGDSRGRLT